MTPPPPLVQRIANLLTPLEGFYAQSGVPIPAVEPLPGDVLPQPYRSLLVHDQDMTSTLEHYWSRPLRVRVLAVRRDGDLLNRQVLLITDPGDQAVEYGAIEIDLGCFQPAAREEIIACRLPLGAILRRHAVAYICRPRAFFRIAPDSITSAAFQVKAEEPLYGRHNMLLDPAGRRLAEVVEILAPARPDPGAPNPAHAEVRSPRTTS